MREKEEKDKRTKREKKEKEERRKQGIEKRNDKEEREIEESEEKATLPQFAVKVSATRRSDRDVSTPTRMLGEHLRAIEK